MRMTALLLAAAIASPAFAQDYHQQDPHQPWNDGSSAMSQSVEPGGVARGWDPGTRRLNSAVAARANQDRDDQLQHQRDVDAYQQERIQRWQRMRRDQRQYANEQRAYEASLDDWHRRDWACRHGDRYACEAPPSGPGYGASSGDRDPLLPYALDDPYEAYPR